MQSNITQILHKMQNKTNKPTPNNENKNHWQNQELIYREKTTPEHKFQQPASQLEKKKERMITTEMCPSMKLYLRSTNMVQRNFPFKTTLKIKQKWSLRRCGPRSLTIRKENAFRKGGLETGVVSCKEFHGFSWDNFKSLWNQALPRRTFSGNLPRFRSVPLVFHLRYLPAFATSQAQQKMKPFNKAKKQPKEGEKKKKSKRGNKQHLNHITADHTSKEESKNY